MQGAADWGGAVSRALIEAASMLAATKDAAEGEKVTMTVPQFRKLARLLEATAHLAEREQDRFDAPIDGVRFWVPLPLHQAERAKLEQRLANYERARFY